MTTIHTENMPTTSNVITIQLDSINTGSEDILKKINTITEKKNNTTINTYLTLAFFIPTLTTIISIAAFTVPNSFINQDALTYFILLPLIGIITSLTSIFFYNKITPQEETINLPLLNPFNSLLISLTPILLTFLTALTDTLF